MSLLRHFFAVMLSLGLILVLPAFLFTDVPRRLAADDADGVTSASVELPDMPSGNYVVLMNAACHNSTIDAWSDFFREIPVGVIMEDISCIVADSDAQGMELARRYQSRLAENQMTLRTENATLLASKAESGMLDVVILSEEIARAYGFESAYEAENVKVIFVEDGQ